METGRGGQTVLNARGGGGGRNRPENSRSLGILTPKLMGFFFSRISVERGQFQGPLKIRNLHPPLIFGDFPPPPIPPNKSRNLLEIFGASTIEDFASGNNFNRAVMANSYSDFHPSISREPRSSPPYQRMLRGGKPCKTASERPSPQNVLPLLLGHFSDEFPWSFPEFPSGDPSEVIFGGSPKMVSKGQGPLNGGVSNGGVSRSGLVLPFLSFFVLFGIFPICSGICPICPFPLSRPFKSTYEEQSRKGPRHNLDLSQKKWETRGSGNSPV